MQKNKLIYISGAAFPHGGRDRFFLNEKSFTTGEKELFFLAKTEFLNRKIINLNFYNFCVDNGVHFNVLPGKVMMNGKLQEDQLFDDSAIVCKTKEGLVIITGCSHSGICNVIEYAKKICNENRVADIIGGFHLLNTNDDRLNKICEFFKKSNIKNLHMCHCTDFKAKKRLSKVVQAHETGVGLVLEY